MRSQPLGAQLLHRLGPVLTVEAVQVEAPLQVVALVLDTAGHELLPLDDHLLAVQVGALGPGVPGALRGEPQPRDRQASLVPVLVLILGELDDLGVEDVADLAIDVPGEGTQADPDLVGRQARTAVLIDRLEQVL